MDLHHKTLRILGTLSTKFWLLIPNPVVDWLKYVPEYPIHTQNAFECKA